MNRPIKFRAWDIQGKKFIKSDYFAIGLDGTLIQHNICYNDDPDDTWDDSWNEELDDEKYIIQQFTGLLDKNGREIYEGDIVKYKRCHSISIEERKNVFTSKLIEDGEEVGEIIFLLPGFSLSFDHKRYDDIECMPLATHRYEVIGNIFENPDLLAENS